MLPWQRHNRCHSVSFEMYLSCAKFKEHHFDIARDILELVFYCLSGVITFRVCIRDRSFLCAKLTLSWQLEVCLFTRVT